MPDYRPEWVATSDLRFGERVRAIRKRIDMSQLQLAEALQERHGVAWHQTTVGKVEAGSRPTRLAEALAVADVLGVNVAELLDQPANTDDDAERRHDAALYHARVSEIENMERDLGRRKRQLKHWQGRDAGWSQGAEVSDGQHREAP